MPHGSGRKKLVTDTGLKPVSDFSKRVNRDVFEAYVAKVRAQTKRLMAYATRLADRKKSD